MGCFASVPVKTDGAAVLSETNLVPNPTFDLHVDGENSPLGWNVLHRGGEYLAKWEDTPGVPHSGSHCLKIESNTGGDGEWYADVRVDTNTEYRLSGEIKGKDVKGGAYFAVSNLKVKTETVTGSVDDWKRFAVTFNTAENVVVRLSAVFGGGVSASGVVWYDTIDLVRIKGVDKQLNLVPNPAIIHGVDGKPYGWTYRHVGGAAAEGVWATGPGVARVGSHCLSIKSEGETHASWYCDIRVEKKTSYQLSAWIKSSDVKGEGAYFTLANIQGVKTPAVAGSGDYQKVDVTFNSGDVECVRVVAWLGPNTSGQAWYDDIELVKSK